MPRPPMSLAPEAVPGETVPGETPRRRLRGRGAALRRAPRAGGGSAALARRLGGRGAGGPRGHRAPAAGRGPLLQGPGHGRRRERRAGRAQSPRRRRGPHRAGTRPGRRHRARRVGHLCCARRDCPRPRRPAIRRRGPHGPARRPRRMLELCRASQGRPRTRHAELSPRYARSVATGTRAVVGEGAPGEAPPPCTSPPTVGVAGPAGRLPLPSLDSLLFGELLLLAGDVPIDVARDHRTLRAMPKSAAKRLEAAPIARMTRQWHVSSADLTDVSRTALSKPRASASGQMPAPWPGSW